MQHSSLSHLSLLLHLLQWTSVSHLLSLDTVLSVLPAQSRYCHHHGLEHVTASARRNIACSLLITGQLHVLDMLCSYCKVSLSNVNVPGGNADRFFLSRSRALRL